MAISSTGGLGLTSKPVKKVWKQPSWKKAKVRPKVDPVARAARVADRHRRMAEIKTMQGFVDNQRRQEMSLEALWDAFRRLAAFNGYVDTSEEE